MRNIFKDPTNVKILKLSRDIGRKSFKDCSSSHLLHVELLLLKRALKLFTKSFGVLPLPRNAIFVYKKLVLVFGRKIRPTFKDSSDLDGRDSSDLLGFVRFLKIRPTFKDSSDL